MSKQKQWSSYGTTETKRLAHCSAAALSRNTAAGMGIILLGAGLALGVLFASCENEQLTKDDVKAAVDESIKNSGAGGKTLESEFKRNLEGDGYAVSGGIGGGFTVTCETGSASLTFGGSGGGAIIPSTMQFNDAAGNQKSYTVQLKLKSGTPDNVVSARYYATYSVSATPAAEKTLTFDVKIIDQKDNSKQSTTVTLVAKYTDAGVLKAAAASFEASLQSAFSFSDLTITDDWTDKEISAWGQTDAQYSATVEKHIYNSSSCYINLPTLSGSVSWTEPTASPMDVTFSGFSGSSPRITFSTSLTAGTITVPFTLTSAVDSAKTVKGKLILTTKA